MSGRTPAVTASLLPLLETAEGSVRADLCRHLKNAVPRELADPLIRAMRADPEASVREEAAETLGPLRAEPAVAKALEVMSSKNLGALLVVEKGRVVGIFSERDALRKRLYEGKGLDRPVREVMTANPEVLTPHDPIALAMNRMGMGGYRHVPLVDGERRPVGMLVMRDVVRYIVRFFPNVALNVPPHSVHEPPERNVEGG